MDYAWFGLSLAIRRGVAFMIDPTHSLLSKAAGCRARKTMLLSSPILLFNLYKYKGIQWFIVSLVTFPRSCIQHLFGILGEIGDRHMVQYLPTHVPFAPQL